MAFISRKLYFLAVLTLTCVCHVNSKPTHDFKIVAEPSPDKLIITGVSGIIDATRIHTKVPIKKLWISNSKVDDITEDFLLALKDLEFLQISGNSKFPEITKADMRGFPKLKNVNIFDNRHLIVQHNAFSDLKDLRYLTIDNVERKTITKHCLAGLDLTLLSLIDNQLEDIEADAFATQSHLKHIRLSHNKLSEIKSGTFKGLDELEELSLQDNKFDTINLDNFDKLPSLRFLNLANNKFTSLDARKLTELFPKLKRLNIPKTLPHSQSDVDILAAAKITVRVDPVE